jgi:single-stranded-DNA-specific exonuclease
MDRLSLTGKRWNVRSDFRSFLDGSVDDGRILATLLAQERELGTPDTSSGIIDAQIFPDFPKAKERLLRAIEQKEKIAVFGDYDCDGITSSVLLHRMLQRRGIDPLIRLPHRMDEGYGLKPIHIEEFEAAGITLLLTVDTGVSARTEIARAKEKGMDVIVLDHHHVPPELPPAYAIIHPILSLLALPHPAAAGVVLSFVQGMEENDWEDKDTDIALGAIGTIADLVELRGFNRTLVQQGLESLRRSTNSSLSFLLTHAGLSEGCTCRDVAFRIAPRINAAGRMADPTIALRALQGHHESLMLLEDLNNERQQTVLGLTESALEELADTASPFLCIASTTYTSGIVGLIAGKLTEKYGKPSLVASIRDGMCIASLRSIPGYDIAAGLERISDLLTSFGGHAQAAGCSFPEANLPLIDARMSGDIAATMTPEDLTPTLTIDTAIDPKSISKLLCEELSKLEPFGQGNPEPRFLIENVTLHDVRQVGQTGSHLQAKLGQHKIIGFGLGELAPSLTVPVDLTVHVGMNTWQGVTSVQLFLDDVRTAMRVGDGVRVGIQQ